MTMKVRVKRRQQFKDPVMEQFASSAVEAVAKLAGVEEEITGPTPAAGVPFPITHGLGEKPERISTIDHGDLGGIIYSAPEDRARWTATTILARCTVSGDRNITVRLTRRP